MKTMTCQQLGGPCDLAHRGDTADDIIVEHDAHLKAAEKDGDAAHQEARNAMKGRWLRPKKSLDWYFGIKKTFADLPND